MYRPITPILIWAALALSNPAAAFTCPRLDSAVKQSMNDWQVPGMSVGIVKDGKTVFQQSYGIRDVENRNPVTKTTHFATGSITKSLTALGLTLAENRGILKIDQPVKSLLPYFPASITIKHLLSHTAGWPRHDALWYFNTYPAIVLSQKLSLLPRFAAPGASFQYNNVPFATVGHALEKATGISWEQWIRTKIIKPAGMTTAITQYREFRDMEDRATPYFPAANGRVTLSLRNTDSVAPAAALYANLKDMLRYVKLLANRGRIDGRQVIPSSAIDKLAEPAIRGYGLGLRLRKWQGETLAFHPGFVDGYGARLSLLPDRKAGVIVLTNLSGENPAPRIVSSTALDCLTGTPGKDWPNHFGRRPPPPDTRRNSSASLPLDKDRSAYHGSYDHPAYGSLHFLASGQGATLKGVFTRGFFTLDYAGNDRWRLRDTVWPLRQGLIFSFSDLAGDYFGTVSTPLADGPTYQNNAGDLTFRRIRLPSQTETPN